MKKTGRFSMVFYLTLFIFGVSTLSGALFFGLWLLAYTQGWLTEAQISLWTVILVLLAGSLILSTSIVGVFGNRILFRSIRQLREAASTVAQGDFSPQLDIPKEKEMGEMAEAFNEMVRRLRSQELIANDFIANISHEFRNPLSSIQGYAQLLESGPVSDTDRQEYAGIILEKSRDMNHMVTNILELSRLENRGMGDTTEVFPLDEQLRKVLLGLEEQWEAKHISLHYELADTRIRGNRVMLGEVWQNLLENAIKFTPDGGKIAVFLTHSGEQARVRIMDDGIGMDEETAKRAFDKFFQGDRSKSTLGNGLGLSLVKKIVTLSGGEIRLESYPGMGTSVDVFLPCPKEENHVPSECP